MKTEAARTAQAIKKELKAEFPTIKFSVTSDNFSMGNSVRVEWTDGPTTDKVEMITDKYCFGHFDGMTDMYEMSNRNADLPQAKFITSSRNASEKVEAFLKGWIEEQYLQENGFEEYDRSRIYYQELRKWHMPELMFENLPTEEVLSEEEMTEVMDNGTIETLSKDHKAQVFSFAFGGEFMKSDDKGSKKKYSEA